MECASLEGVAMIDAEGFFETDVGQLAAGALCT